ncbi:MAG: LysM peptidoglycan-binding domain-containing protein [Anaerolineae bacterium]
MRRYVPYLTVFILVFVLMLGMLISLTPAAAQQGGEETPTPRARSGEYVVQAGDTMDGIAQEFDISYQYLLAVNDITDSTTVPIGTVLVIPDGAPGYGEFPPVDANGNVIIDLEGVGGGGDEVYVLQPGDTLDGVAQQFDVSYQSLLRANDITNAQNVPAGTVLIIPSDAPAYGVFPPLEGSEVDLGTGGGATSTTYVVQEGDTYQSIAEDFGIEVLDLLQANNITSVTGSPEVGTELVIPASQDSASSDRLLQGNQYVLQPGDTLDGVAQQFDVSYEYLLAANNITNAQNVPAGTVLTIPDGAPGYGEFPPVDAEGNVIVDLEGVGGGGQDVYVLQPGDTLDGVAQQLNISYQYLLAANNITNAQNVRAGTILIIPDGAPAYGEFPPVDASGNVIVDLDGVGGGGDEVYILQPGDTLDGVAQQFNVSYQSLLEANDITNSRNVRAGTVIVIPAGAPPYGEFPANDSSG